MDHLETGLGDYAVSVKFDVAKRRDFFAFQDLPGLLGPAKL